MTKRALTCVWAALGLAMAITPSQTYAQCDTAWAQSIQAPEEGSRIDYVVTKCGGVKKLRGVVVWLSTDSMHNATPQSSPSFAKALKEVEYYDQLFPDDFITGHASPKGSGFTQFLWPSDNIVVFNVRSNYNQPELVDAREIAEDLIVVFHIIRNPSTGRLVVVRSGRVQALPGDSDVATELERKGPYRLAYPSGPNEPTFRKLRDVGSRTVVPSAVVPRR